MATTTAADAAPTRPPPTRSRLRPASSTPPLKPATIVATCATCGRRTYSAPSDAIKTATGIFHTTLKGCC